MIKIMLMGSDEQITQSGRLLEDYASSRKRLVLLMQEAERTADVFADISKHIKEAHATAYVNIRGIDNIPTQARLRELVKEIHDEYENKSRLRSALADHGVDIQEDSGFLKAPSERR